MSTQKKKKITFQIKLVVPAGEAKPSPPIGPALGPKGVPAPKFCQEFNAYTEGQKIPKGTPTPVTILVYEDRSYTFTTGTPPTSYLLKKAANIESGSKKAGTERAGKITMAQVREIAITKMSDMRLDSSNDKHIESAMKTVMGTALSSGIQVIENN